MKLKPQYYIWCLLLIGFLGFVFYTVESPKIFPSASIDLSVPSSRITAEALEFASKLGYKHPDAITSTVFSFDDDGKTFLEYEIGAAKANELMRSEIPIWYWITRSCKPLEQEEFTSWISPSGALIAFQHTVPNDRAAPSITDEQAKAQSISFALAHGVDLKDYKIIEEAVTKQHARTDHSIVWENTVTNYHGAKVRVATGFVGDQLSLFSRYLYVPEAFAQKFKKIRSYNEALFNAADLFDKALTAGAFFVFLWALAAGVIRLRFALTVALIYALLTGLESLNSLPTTMLSYDASLPFSAFQLKLITDTLRESGSTFCEILVLVGAGETIYRLMKPHDIALENLFRARSLRDNKTIENVAVGFALFGIHLGWICLYYLGGRHLGFWSPLEVDNAESLSSVIPFFSAMQVGWSAGLTEELTYRIIGLAAFKKIVRNFWVANLLQAMAWAFMHSNYPQEPPYARGLELTVIGFIYGAALRRYGLFACFLSHNLIDTYMGIAPLLASSMKALQASALLALAPFAACIAASACLLKKYGFTTTEEEQPLLNQATKDLAAPPIELATTNLSSGYLYKPLGNGWRAILAAIALSSLGIIMFFSFPQIGEHARLGIGREQAIKLAKDYLIREKIKPDGYSTVTWLGNAITSDEWQYVYEIAHEPMADKLAMNPERPWWWQVRFYKPLVQEFFVVALDQDGKPISITVTEPETAPGEKLEPAEARRRVQAFLNSTHPELIPYEFEDDEPKPSKKDFRTDYQFRAIVPKYKIGEAKYQAAVDVIGGRVSGYQTSWDVPDKWRWRRGLKTIGAQIAETVMWAAGLVCLVAMFIWGRGILRSGAISWRSSILLGLAISLFSVAKGVNDFPLFFYNYETTLPLNSYYIDQSVGYMALMLSAFAIASVVSAFGLASLRLLLPNTTLGAIVKSTLTPATAAELKSHRDLWADAVLVGYAAAFGDMVLSIVSKYIRSQCAPSYLTVPLESLVSYANVLDPALGALIDGCQRGFYIILVAAIAVGVYAKFFRSFKKYMLFGLLAGLIIVGTYKYWQEAAVDYATLAISIACTWLFVAKFAKENLLAYFLTGTASVLVFALQVLSRLGGSLYYQDCAAIAVFLAAPAMYAVFRQVGTLGTKEQKSLIVETTESA